VKFIDKLHDVPLAQTEFREINAHHGIFVEFEFHRVPPSKAAARWMAAMASRISVVVLPEPSEKRTHWRAAALPGFMAAMTTLPFREVLSCGISLMNRGLALLEWPTYEFQVFRQPSSALLRCSGWPEPGAKPGDALSGRFPGE